MASNTIFGQQNWQSIYINSNNQADFASYDFQTIRKSFLDYLQLQNPENFNDYINSSEYITLIDLIAFMGQSLSFRFDLNARENFLSTAQSRNSVINLAQLINYQPQRNLEANGQLKIASIMTNDNVYDSLGNNLNGITIYWNDPTNRNWLDQWNSIINATLTNSQTIGNPGNTQTINGIPTSEYGIQLPSNTTAPFAYTATVDATTMNFEVVDPTSVGQTYIYEVDPYDSTIFNLLYQNDNLGYASNNTGYFLYFKQGQLISQQFSITESLPNRTVDLTATGVNNTDVWLYQVNPDGTLSLWTQVPAIYGQNAIYNNIPASTKTIYSIQNRTQDAITLVFGDGIFSQIPLGNFIAYTRTSNGLSYRINPSEMSNVQIAIPYVSKLNRTQTLTVIANLTYTVGNSAPRESISDIKVRAPQNYYTQNRMVNGQDYNSFPFTQFSNIVQVKAVNRTSSGVSRYLDVIDPTGAYSSTNIFCNDGFLYQDAGIQTNTYSFASRDDLANIVENNILPAVAQTNLLAFFYENYPVVTPVVNGTNTPNTEWELVLTDNSSCSGWLADRTSGLLVNTNDPRFAPQNANSSVLVQGAILQFVPPAGYVFDINDNLVANQGPLQVNQSNVIYAAVETITLFGNGDTTAANGTNVDGSGAILLSKKVPSGAILTQVLPSFTPSLPANIVQSLINNLIAGNALALEYNAYNVGTSNPTWIIDTTLPMNFNPATYGTTFTTPSASPNTPTTSWLLAFVPGSSSNSITVYQRSINYYFGSQQQTTFYFDGQAKVYNPANGDLLEDTVTILQTNSLPGAQTNQGFASDVPMSIVGTVDQVNGYLDTSRVQVGYSELSENGIPDDPFFFTDIVGSALASYVFFVTNNSTATTTLIPSGPTAVQIVANPQVINNNLYGYADGTIIFSQSNTAFYQVKRVGSIATVSTLNNPGDTLTYTYFVGRQNLKFQYQHNASNDRRIDPSPSNIIDLYILDQTYATDYQAWITDTTGQVPEPTPPTPQDLANEFSSLTNYSMVSDLIIYNPAQFVPLFGAQADPQAQATFVVVANPNVLMGTGQIQSAVITATNQYFTVGNFNFGQTFYASDLTTYLHTQLSSIVSSVQIVPKASNLFFGDLQEILALPNQIFISCATAANVQVVTSLNNINLKIGS